MKVEQIYELMNDVSSEVLGETGVIAEDLSNVVDFGNRIIGERAVDNYVHKLVDRIGRLVVVDRVYRVATPSVMRDGWEYGSILEKIQFDMPEAVENESWMLQNNTSYDPNVFHAPSVSVKFFNDRVTYEIDLSITEMQIKESFAGVAQLNSFLSGLYNSVQRSMAVKLDALIMRLINAMSAETIHDDYGGTALSSKSGVKAVNLLYLYNQTQDTPITADDAMADKEFIRFASLTMGKYADRMTRMTTLFNIGGKERFTPRDMLHVVLLSDFARAADAYLQSDTYHDVFTALPKAEIVPYWQGSGTGYAFSDISKIDVKTPRNNEVEASGILGVMFDHDALCVANLDEHVTTHYNPKAEFYNNFYKQTTGLFADDEEQFVVFFIA